MVLRSLLALLLAVCLTGCGTLCDRANWTAKSFTDKAMPCGATDSTPDFSHSVCETSMSACTASDRQTLAAYFDCLEKLPACEPTKSAEFSAAVLACANPMAGLSDGCFRQ
ncbi:MAG: hypothetical protein AB1938_31095 [Myxococcota bacterium]